MGTPIIIIGAGRSGTKILRSILSSHPDVVCFPREINYIWRFGNAGLPTDELTAEHARVNIIRYIKKRFRAFSSRNDNKRVVEKTCANSLRVDFVHAIFPDAHFIHLIRDGRSVAESARRCWQSRTEVKYLVEKLQWVPARDVPYYGLRYLRYQLGRFGSSEKAQSSWGPRFTGMDELFKSKSLIEVCALQWKACVYAADRALKRLPRAQTVTVKYEDLVCYPESVAGRIFERLDLDFSRECKEYVTRHVQKDFVNKWKKALSEHDFNLVYQHIEEELLHFGYKV